MGWYKVDGSTPPPDVLSLNQTICRGEVQKAALASPEPDGPGFAMRQRENADGAYIGCMAGHGFLLKEIR